MMNKYSFVYNIVRRRIESFGMQDEYYPTFDEELYFRAFNEFYFDYKRWYPNDEDIEERKVLLTPQLIVMLLYRLAHECFLLPDSSSTKKDADIYALVGRDIGQMEIFYSSTIGRGLRINHGIGSVIGARCIIGDNCLIHQNCTLGDKDGGRPKLGNNVIMYAGSMVLGNVTIGDNSIIGANSVVLNDFPANSILVGTPAKNLTIAK